jgi:hypothetical protein
MLLDALASLVDPASVRLGSRLARASRVDRARNEHSMLSGEPMRVWA